MRILGEVRKLGIPVLTDIHEPAQAGAAAESVDILQIRHFSAVRRICSSKRAKLAAP